MAMDYASELMGLAINFHVRQEDGEMSQRDFQRAIEIGEKLDDAVKRIADMKVKFAAANALIEKLALADYAVRDAMAGFKACNETLAGAITRLRHAFALSNQRIAELEAQLATKDARIAELQALMRSLNIDWSIYETGEKHLANE